MDNIESDSMKKFIENLTKERNIEKDKIANILNNPDYMDNLVKKLRINYYIFEETNDKERYNTYKELSFLYKLVNNYAKDNNLYPVCQSYYDIYYLQYNGYIFSIFKKNNDGNIIYGCYLNFLKKNELPYCIEFDDIKANNMIDINNFTDNLVAELKGVIDKLYKEGFPLYFIQQLVDNMIEQKRKNVGQTTNEEKNIYCKKF